MESFKKEKLTPGQEILESMYLVPGTKIKLVKQSSDKESEVSDGTILEGLLDFDVKIGEPIFLNNKTKNTSPISAIRRDGDKFFIKTNTSIYELVPPSGFDNNKVSKSNETLLMENRIENDLKRAQINAIGSKDLLLMIEKRFELNNKEKTSDTHNQIKLLDEQLMKFTVDVETIIEFKILMEKLKRNYYSTMGTIAHENAHANMTESLGGTHHGYSVIVFIKDDGNYGYQPINRYSFESSLNNKERIEKEIRATNAPKEYGNKLSPGDEEKIYELKKQLKNM